MNFMRCLLTENRCYKTGKKIKPKGVMVHSTGANNPYLKRYIQPLANAGLSYPYDPPRMELQRLLGKNANANDWNRSNVDACVHAFIGKLEDGSVAVVQTLPWDYRGWHAGTGTTGRSANDTHISFEICEDDLTNPAYFRQVYDAAVELTASLCFAYGLNPMQDGVVICHQDGYQRGIASNHADIYHWFPKYNRTMNDFRRDVVNKIEEMKDDMAIVRYSTYEDIPDYYQGAVKKAMDAGALKGTAEGILDVSEDLCRTLTVLDRLGKLD